MKNVLHGGNCRRDSNKDTDYEWRHKWVTIKVRKNEQILRLNSYQLFWKILISEELNKKFGLNQFVFALDNELVYIGTLFIWVAKSDFFLVQVHRIEKNLDDTKKRRRRQTVSLDNAINVNSKEEQTLNLIVVTFCAKKNKKQLKIFHTFIFRAETKERTSAV